MIFLFIVPLYAPVFVVTTKQKHGDLSISKRMLNSFYLPGLYVIPGGKRKPCWAAAAAARVRWSCGKIGIMSGGM